MKSLWRLAAAACFLMFVNKVKQKWQGQIVPRQSSHYREELQYVTYAVRLHSIPSKSRTKVFISTHRLGIFSGLKLQFQFHFSNSIGAKKMPRFPTHSINLLGIMSSQMPKRKVPGLIKLITMQNQTHLLEDSYQFLVVLSYTRRHL